MVWIKGNQEKRYNFSAKKTNKKILEIEELLNEADSRILLYEFFRNNVTFAADWLLGISLFPFQALMLRGMFNSDYSMFVLSRGAGKSFLAGVYVILECLLNQGCKIGIIAPSFRQSKVILQKVEEILLDKKSKLVRECGFKKLSKGTDQWTFNLGKSSAIALPLANGERLRGFRFSQILLDEFLGMPEKIFNEVILPFLGVYQNPKERSDLKSVEDRLIKQGKMKEEDRYKWPNNKLMILSSPSFEFEYMAKVYKQYCDLIMGDHENQRGQTENQLLKQGAYRLVWQMSYDCLPEEMYDQNLLNQAKATMSEAQFQREFGARFGGGPSSYFSMAKMFACTIPDGEHPNVEIVGARGSEYILAFDPSWSESDTSDDWAIQVGKINREQKKITLVHSYAISGANTKAHMHYFKYLLDCFNIRFIVGDNAGGLTFLSACRESKIFDGYKFDFVEGEFEKPEDYNEDLIKLKSSLDPENGVRCFLRKFNSNWIRQANELLQANIDHRRIMFASRPSGEIIKRMGEEKIPIKELKWDNNYDKSRDGNNDEDQIKFDFLEHQKTMIEQTKIQCATIEVYTNPQGTQSFRLPPHMERQTGPDKARRDSYSALLILNWAAKVYMDSMEVEEKKQSFNTFLPFGC